MHAFQGDEKDVILFSLGLSDTTKQATYEWLKNNRELINVATSRARDELVVFGSDKNLSRLHDESDDDDLFELRLRYENNQYRAFYCYAVGDLIYVLSGFVKKTQKTPVQEIRSAHKIMKGLGL